MKVNWKLRFSNKVTLTAIVFATITLTYQVLGIFGIVPSISESQIIDIAGLVINLLVLLGIVTDPTTKGLADSKETLALSQPKDTV